MLDYISTFVQENKIDISFLFSKLLGYCIVVFSIILKLPQIINMLKIKSDRGLSYLTMYTEILIFLFSFLYCYHNGNPFSTYGENVFILIQCLIILFLCWSYSEKASTKSVIFRVLFLGSLILITVKCIEGKDIPDYVWTLLATSPILLSSMGRMSQIFVSFRQKDTGSLSAITYFLGMTGAITRIFTTYTETKDLILISSFAYGAFLNLVILIQILSYGDNNRIVKEKKNN